MALVVELYGNTFFVALKQPKSRKAPRVCLLYCLKTETCIQGSFITFLVLWRVFLYSKLIKEGPVFNCASTYQRCFKKRRNVATWVKISEIATGVLLCFATIRC